MDLDAVWLAVNDGIADRPRHLDARRHRMSDAISNGRAVERMHFVRPRLRGPGREFPLRPLSEEEILRAREPGVLVLILVRH